MFRIASVVNHYIKMARRDQADFSTVLNNFNYCGQESIETLYPGVPKRSQSDFKVPNFSLTFHNFSKLAIRVQIPSGAKTFCILHFCLSLHFHVSSVKYYTLLEN